MGNLSVPRTRLVGRADELASVEDLLFRRSRLVTLTGVGGVGKTRLALAAAEALRTRFRDGVWLVELSPLTDGALLAHVIAEALPLADQTTRPVIDVVAEYLAGREALLVLDTCEHLTGACALAAEALLRAAPGLRILATSRCRLGLTAEEALTVEPLPLPVPVPVPENGTATDPADALTLLIQRAAQAVPGFTLTDANRPDLVRLCRDLDGLPLAIELAAARLREMSLTELVARLDDRLAVLGNSDEVVYDADPPRHQALRTAIGWSHELCTPAERLLWARLSVFAGSFDAEGVRQVCADDRLAPDALQGLLGGLVEKSIVTWLPAVTGERYRMLDTIREYGGQWLRAIGEEVTLRRRHRDHCLLLARRAEDAWLGPDQYAWHERTTAEHDNLRAALEFCLEEPAGRTATELAWTLWFFWHCCGFTREGAHYLERALAHDVEPSLPRARALWASSLLLATLGDADAAERDALECAAVGDLLGDEETIGRARSTAAFAMVIRGETEQAGVLSRDLFDGHRCQARLTHPTLAAGLFIAHGYTRQGRFGSAVAVLEHLRADCERHGEKWMRAYADYLLARTELVRGDHEAARRRSLAALEVKRRLNDRLGTAMCLDVIAAAAVAAGHAERGARLLGLAQQQWNTLGQPQLGLPEWVAEREKCEREARGAIGPGAYETAYEEGRALAWDMGIAYALGH
ncbi:ATP-binding protein [Streptomyces sp. NPDC102394]|uniref:ATP-binding protein n=1 Tax=Streptomyces sp. NPDC102394 TaxID=3366167 RepID=UPI00380B7816